MLRTIFFAAYFIVYLVLSLLFTIPLLFFKIIRRHDLAKGFIQARASEWGRLSIMMSGSRVVVNGRENIPSGNVLVIGNHQSNIDILVIIGYIPKLIGFIAKKELSYIPILNIWMKYIGCVFIDRKSMRKSAEAISEGAKKIREGNSMLIFPEGHRSKSSKMNAFKPGSLKLAAMSGAVILPVTISGSYKVLEEKNIIRPSEIKFTIHPPIDYKKLSKEEQDGLVQTLEKTISGSI